MKHIKTKKEIERVLSHIKKQEKNHPKAIITYDFIKEEVTITYLKPN